MNLIKKNNIYGRAFSRFIVLSKNYHLKLKNFKWVSQTTDIISGLFFPKPHSRAQNNPTNVNKHFLDNVLHRAATYKRECSRYLYQYLFFQSYSNKYSQSFALIKTSFQVVFVFYQLKQ